MGAKVLTVEDDNSIRGFLVTILKRMILLYLKLLQGKRL